MSKKSSDATPFNKVETRSDSIENPIGLKIETVIATQEVVPVEKLIKGLKPDQDGLYPHEILLLHYAPKYYLEENSFPGFWWYKYGVKNVHQGLQSLLARGFLKAGSLDSALQRETVSELKNVLRPRVLKVTGRKSDLVNRLLTEVPEQELKRRFTRYTYELTESGKEALHRASYIPFIHRQNIEGLDIWSLSEMVQNNPKLSYRDIIWRYLNERRLLHIREGNYGLYRNCSLAMSEFVWEEGRLNTAFSLLAEVISYDLSGLTNGFEMKYLEIYARSYFPYEESTITIPPAIIRRVVEYRESKEYTNDQLKQKLFAELEKCKLPFRAFSAKECAAIVLMEIDEDVEGLRKIYNKAKRRLEKEFHLKL